MWFSLRSTKPRPSLAAFLIRVHSFVFVAKRFLKTNHAHDAVSLQPKKPSGLSAENDAECLVSVMANLAFMAIMAIPTADCLHKNLLINTEVTYEHRNLQTAI